MTAGPERGLIGLGALAGIAGVAASAAAAHVTGPGSLKVAADFLLFHAPALLALAALSGRPLLRHPLALAGGYAIALGLLLFSGDLSVRALGRRPLFAMAAPAGGLVLMGGWVLVGLAAALGGSTRS